MVHSDIAILADRGAPVLMSINGAEFDARHPLRLGDLIGRYLGGDDIGVRDNKKAVNESIWLMKGVHAA